MDWGSITEADRHPFSWYSGNHGLVLEGGSDRAAVLSPCAWDGHEPSYGKLAHYHKQLPLCLGSSSLNLTTIHTEQESDRQVHLFHHLHYVESRS